MRKGKHLKVTRPGFIGKVIMFTIALAILFTLAGAGSRKLPADNPLWTDRMNQAHQMAEAARYFGYSEDDPFIQRCKDEWASQNRDLQMIAKTISREASHGCPFDHQVAVGAVILNRVASPAFPNSVYEVLIAPKQYSRSYTYGFNNIDEEYYRAAVAAMNGEHDVPPNVVYQANFKQGHGVWKVSPVRTPYFSSVTYFCYL